MMCSTCHGKGIVRLNWADAPEDYAVCLCVAGVLLRSDRNNSKHTNPLWHVWCAREQVEPSRVVMLEAVLTAEELAERGFNQAPAMSKESALLKADKGNG